MSRALVLAAATASLWGCVDRRPIGTEGQVSSVVMSLKTPDPANLGTPSQPISTMSATFDLQAVDDHGQPIVQDLDVQLYLSFGGVKSGLVSACGSDAPDKVPLETIHLTGGRIENHSINLPAAFGPTTLWIDEPISHATGASPTIYFRNPFIADVQTPPDPAAPNATFCSAFEGKFVVIDQPMTPAGKLVVSSVFGNAFAVTDTSPGNFGSYNSIYIFSFGKPPTYIVPGKVLKQFSGNVSKFIGFTELNFPLFTVDKDADIAQLPPPFPVKTSDISTPAKLLAATAGVVTFTGQQCDPYPANPNGDANVQRTIDQWLKFNQVIVDGDGSCSSLTNFAVELPSKTLGTYDPLKSVGKMVTVVGMLRNNSGQNSYLDANGQPIACAAANPCVQGTCVDGFCKKGAFNFWTVQPRTPDDVAVQ